MGRLPWPSRLLALVVLLAGCTGPGEGAEPEHPSVGTSDPEGEDRLPDTSPQEQLYRSFCHAQALAASADDLFAQVPASGTRSGYTFRDGNQGLDRIVIDPWGEVAVDGATWAPQPFEPEDYARVTVTFTSALDYRQGHGGEARIEGSSSDGTQVLEPAFRRMLDDLFDASADDTDRLWADFEDDEEAWTTLAADPSRYATEHGGTAEGAATLATGSSALFAAGSLRWDDGWSLGFRLPVHEALLQGDDQAVLLRVSLLDKAEWWWHSNETLEEDELADRLRLTFAELRLDEPAVEERTVASFNGGCRAESGGTEG